MKNHVDGVVLVASKAEKGNSRTAGFNKIGRWGRWAVRILVRSIEMENKKRNYEAFLILDILSLHLIYSLNEFPDENCFPLHSQ